MKKLTKNNSIAIWIIGLICIISIFSCDHQWDDFKKYNKDGEILYVGKFDTVLLLPGKEQVRLWGQLTPDPKIVKYKVFWNSNKDSATFDVSQVSDTIKQNFNVGEGVTSFTLYTYDADGNSSVGVTAVGSSYGARYRSTLYNRKIKTIDHDKGGTVINWDLIDMGLFPLQMEIRYKAVTGDTLVIAPAAASTTVLKGLKYQTESFTYRTVYRPVFNTLNCIDTFCTGYTVPTLVDNQLDRSLFAEHPLPGDVGPNGGWPEVGVRKMWDGLGNGYDHSSFTDLNGSLQSSPSIITFDLGTTAKLSKVWILPFRDPTWFSFTAMKRFEIWGSATPNSSGALDASWYKLGSYTVVRPSGRAEGQGDTAEDIALASAGFTWTVDANGPKVRYLRIRCLESFRPGITAQSIGEIKVYGLFPQ